MLRPLRKEDRELYVTLSREFYSSEAVMRPIPDAHFARTFARIIAEDPMVGAFLLLHEGQPAGYALLAFTYSNEAGSLVVWVEEIYIRPAFQGKGLGKEFFEFLSENYADRPVRLRLEVEPDNEGAIRLYKRMGYQKMPYVSMYRDLSSRS